VSSKTKNSINQNRLYLPQSSGLGWFYLNTITGDYSRYIMELCTNMRAEDVTDTLDLALQASGCGPRRSQAAVLTLTGPAMSQATWRNGCKTRHEALVVRRITMKPRQDRAVASDPEEHPAGKLLLAR
jgi:transposase InsO family protein